MTNTASFVGKTRLLSVGMMLVVWAVPVVGAQVNLLKTNAMERWITNLIEVRMPQNRFVNEYQTNWIEQVRTNLVTVYATNQVVRTRTNQVWVDLVRTNFVQAWQTNLKTLNLTNWTTVLVIKTNWVTQPVTNAVEIDLAANASSTRDPGAAREGRGAKEAGWQRPLPVQSARATDGLTIEATTTTQSQTSNQVEVRLAVRRLGGAASPVQVQQWKVESEDGAILCFGQDQEFKRELPVGRYKVEASVRPDKNGLLLRVLGTLAVTNRDAAIQQSLAVAQ